MATIEELVSYLYDELSEAEMKKIDEELLTSWPLREKFTVLKESKRRLNNMELLSPRKQTIEQIMRYAKRSNCHSPNLKA